MATATETVYWSWGDALNKELLSSRAIIRLKADRTNSPLNLLHCTPKDGKI